MQDRRLACLGKKQNEPRAWPAVKKNESLPLPHPDLDRVTVIAPGDESLLWVALYDSEAERSWAQLDALAIVLSRSLDVAVVGLALSGDELILSAYENGYRSGFMASGDCEIELERGSPRFWQELLDSSATPEQLEALLDDPDGRPAEERIELIGALFGMQPRRCAQGLRYLFMPPPSVAPDARDSDGWPYSHLAAVESLWGAEQSRVIDEPGHELYGFRWAEGSWQTAIHVGY
jgi:hypothetical protein